ncbi:heme exporter protein CcmB [Hyphococcus flavus]|uniref:Heme exporter protein B n=1 Tax=Hyphococcus flavus TaxID=1866326 RepID=A0AAE9ZAP2_9PROT|nr:heme exporter protein CcmB [Hyphococcus flavus]WDI30864.1 heme exporter protein CcmB [Hyphococcus flavus]
MTGAILSRDLKVAFRSGGGWFYALFFFAVFTVLAAIAFGPQLSALASAAPAALWLAVALSIQFSAADIFEHDLRDGSLRAFAAEQGGLMPYWLAKALALALTSALPMIIAAPFFMTMLGVPFAHGLGAAVLLVIGAPGLLFVSLLTAALAGGLRAGGLLATIIAAPFAAPLLIFGVSATKIVFAGNGIGSPETLILGALSLFMAAVTPWFAITALRVSLE